MLIETTFEVECQEPFEAVDRDGRSIQVQWYRYLVYNSGDGNWIAAGPVVNSRGGVTGSYDVDVNDIPLYAKKAATAFYLKLGLEITNRLSDIAKAAVIGEVVA